MVPLWDLTTPPEPYSSGNTTARSHRIRAQSLYGQSEGHRHRDLEREFYRVCVEMGDWQSETIRYTQRTSHWFSPAKHARVANGLSSVHMMQDTCLDTSRHRIELAISYH